MVDPISCAVIGITAGSLSLAAINSSENISVRARRWFRKFANNTICITRKDNYHIFCQLARIISPSCHKLQNKAMITLLYPWNTIKLDEKQNMKNVVPRETNETFWIPTSDTQTT